MLKGGSLRESEYEAGSWPASGGINVHVSRLNSYEMRQDSLRRSSRSSSSHLPLRTTFI